MSRGRIVGSYTPETLDIAELGLLMTGVQDQAAGSTESPAGNAAGSPAGNSAGNAAGSPTG